MSVDIRPCDIYDLIYPFLEMTNKYFRKSHKSISYKMDQYSFFGDESKIFFQITLINVGITVEIEFLAPKDRCLDSLFTFIR